MQEMTADSARGQTLSPEVQKINELVREVSVLRECIESVRDGINGYRTAPQTSSKIARLLEGETQ